MGYRVREEKGQVRSSSFTAQRLQFVSLVKDLRRLSRTWDHLMFLPTAWMLFYMLCSSLLTRSGSVSLAHRSTVSDQTIANALSLPIGSRLLIYQVHICDDTTHKYKHEVMLCSLFSSIILLLDGLAFYKRHNILSSRYNYIYP